MNNSRKQSVLIGGLISSAGILISKFLGLLYVIPFNSILETSMNRAYYANAYSIYSYILNIATAGLPFAIATLVARYASRNDYKTCLLVKKISFWTMATFGFLCMGIMILFSTDIAKQVVPTDPGASLEVMRNVIILISLAVFVIPILSSLRGFYQGLREMEIYSISQVLEQIARILFLLTSGALAVYVFNQDAVWALYFGVIAASIAGLLTIVYLKSYDRTKLKEIKKQAKEQEVKSPFTTTEVFKELVYVAIPWLLIAIFGYCDSIINTWDLVPGLTSFGIEATAPYADAILYKATKIIAIPMILAPGFSAAIIPYITTAMENKDIKLVKKYILDCVESVVYIALPICFALFVFARPIMLTLFGGTIEDIDLNAFVLRWFALEALCATICPIFSSIVMAIGYRKKIVINTLIFAIIKFVINRPLIAWIGVGGMVLSSFIAYVVFAALNIYIIQKHYKVNWNYTFRKIVFMVVGIGGFYLVSLLFEFTGMMAYDESRVIALLLLAVMGILCCLAYVGITAFCGIPQAIFKVDINAIVRKITRRGKK